MPVRSWSIMFFVAQSMARVNRTDDLTHPCRTPGFTVNLVVEFPVEELDEFHQLFWKSVVPQVFPKALPVHTVECFFEIYEVKLDFSLPFIALL